MRNNRGLRQAFVSALVFCGVVVGLASFDPRVKDGMQNLIYGGNGITTWDSRAVDLGKALVTAVQFQSIDNSPLMIFAAVGAVLFVFMVKM